MDWRYRVADKAKNSAGTSFEYFCLNRADRHERDGCLWVHMPSVNWVFVEGPHTTPKGN
jgi:hypothetical protein